MRNGTPNAVSCAASASPVGPAPTMRTGSVVSRMPGVYRRGARCETRRARRRGCALRPAEVRDHDAVAVGILEREAVLIPVRIARRDRASTRVADLPDP